MPYVSGGFPNRDHSEICKEGCHVELKRPWWEATDGQTSAKRWMDTTSYTEIAAAQFVAWLLVLRIVSGWQRCKG
jgi:hypothetical protein